MFVVVADPTFAGLEGGRESRPAELYTFTYGLDTYRYTSVETDVVFGGDTYVAIPIKRTSPTQNPRERTSTKLQIQMQATQAPVDDFIGIQPAKRLEVQIVRIQLDERTPTSPVVPSPEPTPAPSTGFIIFEGYVNSVFFKDDEAALDLNPFNEQFTRELPRLKYHSLCNHVLYDTQCQVNKLANTQSGVVNGQDGNVITLSGFTGSDFTGGYLTTAAEDDYRLILNHNNDQFTLLLPFASNVLGATLTAYKGCDHSINTCKTKFNNVINFGGYPYIPGVNPFNQSQFTKN